MGMYTHFQTCKTQSQHLRKTAFCFVLNMKKWKNKAACVTASQELCETLKSINLCMKQASSLLSTNQSVQTQIVVLHADVGTIQIHLEQT